MELLQNIIEKGAPILIVTYWGLVAGVLVAALTRGPLSRKFIEYVANIGDEPDKPRSKTRYA
jgi:hypothetical protein